MAQQCDKERGFYLGPKVAQFGYRLNAIFHAKIRDRVHKQGEPFNEQQFTKMPFMLSILIFLSKLNNAFLSSTIAGTPTKHHDN